MSNSSFINQYMRSKEVEVKQIFAHITFGATGAPTIDVPNSKGIQSVTRNSAGKYTILFGTPASSQAARTDTFRKLLTVNHTFDATGNAGTAPASPSMYVVSNAVTASGSIQIQFNAAGVATDPASGEGVYLRFVLGDSSV